MNDLEKNNNWYLIEQQSKVEDRILKKCLKKFTLSIDSIESAMTFKSFTAHTDNYRNNTVWYTLR